MNHLDIKGWFDWENLYSHMAFNLPDGSNVVEIGVYHGKSLSYYVSQMQLAGKTHNIYAVDKWQNSYHLFLESMFNLNINSLVHPIRAESTLAAHSFPNESIDFCFIDADHRYQSVKADIEAWLPKVKNGFWICGHDFHLSGVRKAVYEIFSPKDVEIWGKSWVYKKGKY